MLIIGGWIKTLAFIVIAPLLGWLLSSLFMWIILWLFRKWNPASADRFFRRGQLVSAGLYSLGHGGNDAQKTMGIIAGMLFTVPQFKHLVANLATGDLMIPLWIVLMAHAAIAFGTLSGGWRIIHTMGSKITKLVPMGGFAAQTAGAVTLFASTALGVPVSTTHTITGAIVGVGSLRRRRAVRWGVASQIVWAWLLTIPISAFLGAGVYIFLSLFI